jgi:hypothetical protein
VPDLLDAAGLKFTDHSHDVVMEAPGPLTTGWSTSDRIYNYTKQFPGYSGSRAGSSASTDDIGWTADLVTPGGNLAVQV